MPSSSARSSRVPLPREIKVLVAAAFIIAIGFGIIAPLLPQYAATFDASAVGVAAVVSVFGLTRLLFAPVSGKLTNRLGETPVYMTGVLIVAASMFLVAFAQTFPQLLLFRALGGVGSTLFTVSAMAFLARKSPPTMRGRISGAYASAFLIGNIVGPIVGSALSVFGYRAPFLIYGSSLVVAAALVFFLLKDTRLADRAVRDSRPAMPVREALSNPSYRAALVSFFANGWATFGVRNSVMPLFAATAFAGTGLLGWQVDGALMAGLALSVFALGNVTAVTFSSRMSDRHGRRPPPGQRHRRTRGARRDPHRHHPDARVRTHPGPRRPHRAARPDGAVPPIPAHRRGGTDPGRRGGVDLQPLPPVGDRAG